MPFNDNGGSAQILFIPHGGGPLPLLDDPGHAELSRFLTRVGTDLATPEAIIVISAHWEATPPAVTSGKHPELIYDYYGFPPESYRIEYPAPGHPELAQTLKSLLQQQGIEAVMAPDRGFDHGLFVPLKLMYPDAGIPCVQLSLDPSLDPETHIRMGEALRPLLGKNLLVLGSGFSFHNLPAFFSGEQDQVDTRNEAFEQWLVDTCTRPDLPEASRRERLVNWAQAPHADYCHPRSEHLIPLHVCYGLAGRAARCIFDGRVMEKQASAFLWQATRD